MFHSDRDLRGALARPNGPGGNPLQQALALCTSPPGSSGRALSAVMVLADLVSLLGGCAGVHVYDQSKDTTAQQAKASYERADLLGIITTERANFSEILEIELDVVQRHIDTVLRVEWFRLAESDESLRISFLEKGIAPAKQSSASPA